MKTLNLILTLIFVLVSLNTTAQTTEPAIGTDVPGQLSFEAIEPDGSVVTGDQSGPRIRDEHLQASCCVQPEVQGFRNPLFSALETLATKHTKRRFDGANFTNICDKVGFFADLNSNEYFLELRKKYKDGVRLQIQKQLINATALLCLAK